MNWRIKTGLKVRRRQRRRKEDVQNKNNKLELCSPGTFFKTISLQCGTNACWIDWSCNTSLKAHVLELKLSFITRSSECRKQDLRLLRAGKGDFLCFWWREVDEDFWEKLPVSDKFCLLSPAALCIVILQLAKRKQVFNASCAN